MMVSENSDFILRMPIVFDKVQTLYNCANLAWEAINSTEEILPPAQYEKLDHARALIEEVEQYLIRDVLLLQCDIEIAGDGTKIVNVPIVLEEIPSK